MSVCWVINEWLFDYLRGDYGREAQVETQRFLEKLKDSQDRIAVLRGSKWQDKAYELMTRTDPFVRVLSKYLHLSILLDSNKCRWIDPGEVQPLQEAILAVAPPDDLYLFETYLTAAAQAIITTDNRLRDRLAGIPDINIGCLKVRSRSQFSCPGFRPR